MWSRSLVYGPNNGVTVWTSPDLSSGSWTQTPDGNVYHPGTVFPNCNYFRSQAVFNPVTGLHVLWANAGCESGESYVTATAPAPGGPYTFRGFTNPTNLTGSQGTGDFALFVDTDGTGYAIVTHGRAWRSC